MLSKFMTRFSQKQKVTLKQLIKRHEGLVLTPYEDSLGNQTIGYGRLLSNGISEDEAELMLDNDIRRATLDAYRILDPDFLTQKLTQNRYNVIINMLFNLGDKRFQAFKKMLICLYDYDWNGAADNILFNTESDGRRTKTKYYEQVGERAEELAKMMREG